MICWRRPDLQEPWGELLGSREVRAVDEPQLALGSPASTVRYRRAGYLLVHCRPSLHSHRRLTAPHTMLKSLAWHSSCLARLVGEEGPPAAAVEDVL